MRNLGTRRIASLARELLPTTRNAEGGSHARVGRSRRQCRLWKTRVGEKTSRLTKKLFLKDNNIKNIMPKINKILEVYLSLDESLVGGDKIVWFSSFLTCCDGGRCCHSAVLCSNYYCDWWSRHVGQTIWSMARAGRCCRSASLCSREAGDALSAWSETLLE